MRALTSIEEEIIKEIVRSKTCDSKHYYSFKELVEHILKSKNFYIRIVSSSIGNKYTTEFLYNHDVYKPSDDRINTIKQNVESEILDGFFLLEFLCKEGLLVELKLEQSKDKTNFEIPAINITKPISASSSYGKTTSKLIFQKLFYTYYIKQDLIDFSKNKFVTEETKRYKKSHFATWIGIILSGLIGLAGIALNICSLNSPTDLTPETINKIDSIIFSNRKLKVDSLSEFQNKKHHEIIEKLTKINKNIRQIKKSVQK